MRILIVQTAFLGDVVLVLPLVAAVRRQFCQADVEVLTVPAHAAVLQGQPGIGRVLTYDKRGHQRGVRGLMQMARVVRKQHYDLVISPHRSWRTAVLVACSGSPQRVGFRQWWTQWAYTDTILRLSEGHEVARNHRLLAALDIGATAQPQKMTLQVPALSQQAAWSALTSKGQDMGDIFIGLIPSSQWGTKRWPTAHFAALIEKLSTRPQTHCILFGAPSERQIADDILQACTAPVIDLVGRTPLQDLPAYLACCTVVVSNDTGPMHVAAAVGKPIVSLYGPTTPALGFSPYGVRWEEASVELDCRPCHAHGPHQCPLGHWKCMKELSVERVIEGVDRLLGCPGLVPEVDR